MVKSEKPHLSIIMHHDVKRNDEVDKIPTSTQVPKSKRTFKFVKIIFIIILLLSVILLVILSCFKLWTKTTEITLNENDAIRQIVKDMTLEAWNAYKQHAWGHDALCPLTESAYNDHFGNTSGRTIISSMSTLWVMGLRDEFEVGKKWIKEKFDLRAIDQDMNVCELVTDFIGGLLSCYALTGDEMFLEKAKQIGEMIEPAYDTPTGLSLEQINPLTKNANVSTTWLTWAGGQQLEYNYLTHLTSIDTKIKSRIDKIRKTLKTIQKPQNLYMERINVIHGNWTSDISSLSWTSSKFYIGLVKSYLQTNGSDVEALQMYKDAFDAIEQNEMLKTSNSGLVFARSWNTDKNFMNYHSCYLGALLSLGSNALKTEFEKYFENSLNSSTENITELSRISRHTEIAENLTETCYQASNRTKTGLAPYQFNFNEVEDAQNLGPDYRILQKGFMLNPELAESYFILWRRTHSPKYRAYAWEMTQAIREHCRTVKNGGYSQLLNVDALNAKQNNYQPAYFIGGTLKYLYLIFSDDDDLLSLDQWIFSTVGQPFPVIEEIISN